LAQTIDEKFRPHKTGVLKLIVSIW